MHYVIGDIHNNLKKLKQILKQINITRDDELIVLGDVFDRGGETADPFGVYCALAGLQGKCSWIRGNHDDWLANYTYEYFNTPEKKRHKLAPYGYNSFELLRQRIAEVDMRNIADLIKGLPLQKELELEGKKYLFAHAMTSHPDVREEDRYYMRGTMDIDCFFFEGIDGIHCIQDQSHDGTGHHTIGRCRKKYHCKSCGKEKRIYLCGHRSNVSCHGTVYVKRGRGTHGCSGHRR